tara:strand:- start:15418 stop:15786 length:369 start_codon:yes stop_codon:yes gene_type:complete
MQKNHILSDNSELWDFLQENGNACEHKKDFIMNYCCAYKVGDKGFCFYNWLDKDTLSIHFCFNGVLFSKSLCLDILNVAYYLGAEKMIAPVDAPDVLVRLMNKYGFKKEGEIYSISLPYNKD